MFRNTSLKPNTIFKENSIMDSVLELYVSQFSKSTEFNYNSKITQSDRERKVHVQSNNTTPLYWWTSKFL